MDYDSNALFANQFGLGKPSAFIAALIERSQLDEVDWMGAAQQAQDPINRAYCLAFVIQRHPENAEARKALEIQLDALRSAARKQNPHQRHLRTWEFVVSLFGLST